MKHVSDVCQNETQLEDLRSHRTVHQKSKGARGSTEEESAADGREVSYSEARTSLTLLFDESFA
jgi:hypothetical protein